jgi:hypothetical protein
VGRLAAPLKWLLLVPLCFGLLAIDVVIARRAVIARRNLAEHDAELARLNEQFKAAQPKPLLYERGELTLF